MDVNQLLQNISERQRQISEIVEIDRDIIFDVGNLTVWDPDNLSIPKAGSKREEYFQQLARDDVQVVLNRLYAMDSIEVVDGERVLKLPEPTTILPRAKPVPEPKPPTKWERFAREKGIKSKASKKRDKLLWDSTTNKWVPRFGYKKVQNDEEKDWVIEIPDQADPNVDYFAKREEEKKEKVAKNKYQQLRNVAARRK